VYTLETTLVQDAWLVFQVILLDLALGGDNSVVIGMAAKNLPRHLQTRAILWGTAGAIGMRFIMAAIVMWLLQIPFLKSIGALILIYIGIKLIGSQDTEENIHIASQYTLFGAIRTIIIADAIMSLDNVLAIVGATNGHLGLLVMGMLISVPIIIFGSTLVVKIMDRYPVIMYVGGLILGWAAGGMIASDEYVPISDQYTLYLKIGVTLLVGIGGFIWQHLPRKQ
jgi:YjbE family integral membrane protein